MKQGVEGAIADEPGSVTLMEENADYSSEEIEGMVPDTLALLTPPDGRTITCFDLDNWQALGDWMVEKDLLKEAIDVSHGRDERLQPERLLGADGDVIPTVGAGPVRPLLVQA